MQTIYSADLTISFQMLCKNIKTGEVYSNIDILIMMKSAFNFCIKLCFTVVLYLTFNKGTY
jgi:hypothetical protein